MAQKIIEVACEGARSVSIDKLNPLQGDLKDLSRDNYKKLRQEILDLGFSEPIATWEESGKIWILNGHQRLRTLLEMRKEGFKIPPIPISVVRAKNEREARLKVLSLTSQYGEMTSEGLYKFMSDSDFSMGDVANSFRFPEIDFQEFKENYFEDEIPAGNIDQDAIPQTVPSRVKTGQVWQLGKHRVMCGDSTNREHIKELFQGRQAGMLFTDPPYGIGYEYKTHNDADADANKSLVANVFALHDCGKVWTPGLMNLARDIERFGKAKIAVWYKKFAQAGNGIGGASTWEPILILNPTKRELTNDVVTLSTERESVSGISLRELHSCPKPVGLYQHLIQALSHEGDLIFEPFGGSGTTLIACEKAQREARIMEIDPTYCDVILKRWEEFTGKGALLATASHEARAKKPKKKKR